MVRLFHDSSEVEERDLMIDSLLLCCASRSFDYLKLDFLYAAALKGERKDPTINTAQVREDYLSILKQHEGPLSMYCLISRVDDLRPTHVWCGVFA